MPIPREQLDRALGIARDNAKHGNFNRIPRPTDEEKAAIRESFDEFVYSSRPTQTVHILLAPASIPEGETPPQPACKLTSGSHGEKNWLTSVSVQKTNDHFCLHCTERWREQVRRLMHVYHLTQIAGVSRVTPLD